jgi:7-cyano-7-deazaguanine synthase
MNTVVLCSGGIDSVTALYWAASRGGVAAALSFDYGAKHNAREIPCAIAHARRLGIAHETIELPVIQRLFSSALLQGGADVPDGHYEESSMKQTVVPFRNAIFLSLATGFAESRGAAGLVIGAHAGDHAVYPDCREGFMGAMGEAMRLGTYAGVRLERPFIALRKSEIVAAGARLGVDFAQTWSCYRGGRVHCGRCGTCVERREAFQVAGLADPTEYADQGPLPPKPPPASGRA